MTNIREWIRLYNTALLTGVRMESVKMRKNVYEIRFYDSANKCFLAYILAPKNKRKKNK